MHPSVEMITAQVRKVTALFSIPITLNHRLFARAICTHCICVTLHQNQLTVHKKKEESVMPEYCKLSTLNVIVV